MVPGLDALPPLEEQSRRQKAERHAVAAVAEREPVTRDSGDADRCREGCLASSRTGPPRRDSVSTAANAGNRVSKYARSSATRPSNCWRRRWPGPHQSIAASQQEPMIRRPSRVVVGPLGVPHHDVGEAELTALVERRSARSPGRRFGTSEIVPPAAETAAVAYPVAMITRSRLDRAVTRPDADAIAIGLDPPHSRAFEHLVRPRRRQRA